MDEQRFDDFARNFAKPTSRRRVLRGLLAAGAASIGLSTGADAAETKRKPGQICRRTSDCVAGTTCDPTSTGRSVCTCVPGTRECGNKCITDSPLICCTFKDCPVDANPCKERVCNADGFCGQKNEADGSSCPAGICCGGACVDSTTDESHCGDCVTQCSAGNVCTTDGCCIGLQTCGTSCCTGFHEVCDVDISHCCFNEQVCKTSTGGEFCCAETTVCCGAAGTQCISYNDRTCASNGACCDNEVCEGGKCCPASLACDGQCCPLGTFCSPVIDQATGKRLCAADRPSGGFRTI